MSVGLNLETIHFYLIKVATDFYLQPSYLLGERSSLTFRCIVNKHCGFMGRYFHRYLREVDCSRHISLQKIHFNKARALVVDTNKRGGW